LFRIVLIEPEIPPNTGNAIRLAANTGCELHLVEPLGFSMADKLLRRAGLDYHEFARVVHHPSWLAWLEHAGPQPVWAFSTRGTQRLHQAALSRGDWLVFGSESGGLPAALRQRLPPERIVRLPMRPAQRSLNLSNAVAVAVYEGWRQLGFDGST
jgi:tRNA (cytidine/uridine-2'-O-)-methyltransferase